MTEISTTTEPSNGLAGPGSPGEYLREWMERTGHDVQWFAGSFGAGQDWKEVVGGILAGTRPVTFDIARDLEITTGRAAEHWLTHEHEHQLKSLQAMVFAECGHGTEVSHQCGRQQLCWGYSAEAAAKADELFVAAVGYHSGPFILAEDAPVPVWLKQDLAGVELWGVEAGWPQFARTDAPVDWVTRLKASPPGDARWHPVYDSRAKPTGEVMDQVHQLASGHGATLGLDVFLYTLEDGAVGVHPCALWLEPAQPALDSRIEELLQQLRPPRDRGREWYRHDGVWEL